MNHFQPKSLAFYGGAIAFVVGLFGVVTTYGEANLKAATSIGGEYRFSLPVSAPCIGGKPVLLSVQQSGVYVAAALTNPALARSPSALKATTLTGQWQNQRLSLAGQVPVESLCTDPKDTAPIMVKIEGAIALGQKPLEADTLTGMLFLNAANFPLIAERQSMPKEQANTSQSAH